MLEESNFFDFEITFNDITLLEANGEYEDVKKLMESPQKFIGKLKESPPSSKWVVKSVLSITHELGYAQLLCDFYYDKKIIILSYASTSNEFHRPDIRCLSHWAQNNGWNVPEPHPLLVREDWDFWKIQWETYIVESEFLKEKVGQRIPQYFEENDDNNDEEEDILEEEN
jgi:hypothetical protein